VIGRRPCGRGSTEDWRHPFWPAPSLDRFVISYPKAGRSWLRVTLAVAEAHARGARAEAVVEEWDPQDDVAHVESRIAELLSAACGYAEPSVQPEVRAGSLSASALHAG
jgi:hypothetical protein